MNSTWLLVFGVAGVALGFVLQRSRLCFVSALRDLFLFRATGMTRSILILLLASSLGGLLVVNQRNWGQPIPTLIGPTDLNATLLGGFLFGIGMVLAGSCAASALWRTGEGQLSQLPILVGLLVGTNIYSANPLFPDAEILATGDRWLQAGALALILSGLIWWQHRDRPMGEEIISAVRKDWWRRAWNPDVGAIILAVLLLLFVILTGQLPRVTLAFLLNDSFAITLGLGLILGGYLSARWGWEWRIRPIGTWSERSLRLAGGLMMGYGARMSAGCTFGRLLNGLILTSDHTLWWLAMMTAGAWIGSLLLRRFISRELHP